MSHPQTLQSIFTSGLWLKGTSTGLKANDPILIDVGVPGVKPVPLRVVDIKADITTERTYVTWRSWSTPQQAAAAVAGVAAKHESNTLSGATADNARAVLAKLQATANELADDPHRLSEFVEQETLPALMALHESVSSRAKNLGPWLRTTIDELSSAHTELRGSLAWDANAIAPETEKQVDPFFDALKRPPSVPPRSAVTLDRTLETALKPGADIFPRLLTAFRPRLAGVLGPALTNASVARPADIKVYALRVSASLFGHNTPAQPLFADPDNKGKVSGFDYPN